MKILQSNIKICPSCGKSFTCNGDGDCWCENVHINKKEMLIIMNKFHDCICPDCLKTYEKD